MAFLQTSGVDFTLNGQKWVPFGGSTYDISTSTSDVDDKLVAAQSMGLNMVRAINWLTHSATTDAEFGESYWTVIDYLLDEAAAIGIKVLLDLSDFTATLANRGHNFLLDNTTEEYIDLWKPFLSFALNRVNTVNGKVYKNDDAIGIFSISGEVNYVVDKTDGTFLHDWFAGTSAYMKGIDANHIIHAGGQAPELIVDNATVLGGYNFTNGQDMLSISTIDCVSTHPYYTFQNMEDLFPVLRDYAIDKQKPWFVEEFGYNQSTTTYRVDAIREVAVRRTYNLGFKNKAAGALFWNIDEGYYNPSTGLGGGFGINSNTPLVFNTVRKFAATPSYLPRIPV